MRNIIAHLENQRVRRTLEEGHVLERYAALRNDARHEIAVLKVERVQERLDNALHETVDETDDEKRRGEPVERNPSIL